MWGRPPSAVHRAACVEAADSPALFPLKNIFVIPKRAEGGRGTCCSSPLASFCRKLFFPGCKKKQVPPLAVAVAPDFGRNDKAWGGGRLKFNFKVKGNGQECPFHASGRRFAPRTAEGGCPYMSVLSAGLFAANPSPTPAPDVLASQFPPPLTTHSSSASRFRRAQRSAPASFSSGRS